MKEEIENVTFYLQGSTKMRKNFDRLYTLAAERDISNVYWKEVF